MNYLNSKKVLSASSIVLLSFTLLSGCASGVKKPPEETVLRITSTQGISDNDAYFRNQYVELFEYAHPNIKIELIPSIDSSLDYMDANDPKNKPKTPFDNVKNAIKGVNPPDVVFMNFQELSTLSSENLLMPLEPFIKKTKFDISTMSPSLLDGLKGQTGGKLYALAPSYSSSALIYNRGMFDSLGLPYPKDGMTWSEILDLAARATHGEGDKKVYGFAFNNYSGDNFSNLLTYSTSLQLHMMDQNAERMTVNGADWEKVWTDYIKIMKDGSTPPIRTGGILIDGPVKEGPLTYDTFLSGRAAMAIVNFGAVNQIVEANRNAGNIQNFNKIDFDFVTVPVHPEQPNIGVGVYFDGLVGVSSTSQNPTNAWDFVNFINSQKYAKIKSKSTNVLSIYDNFNVPKDGLNYNLKAFSKLLPIPDQSQFILFTKYQNLWQVQQEGATIFEETLKGKKTVNAGLQEWESKGNKMLESLKKDPSGRSLYPEPKPLG
jgi:multiple sugar transport system substrate-binding protein